MNTEFVTQYAPELALPTTKGQWVTAEPQAGLEAPQNLYGADGTPLNYIQDQGGQRQFFQPNATPVTAPVAGLRGRSTPEPMPLRGLSPTTGPTFDIPITPTPTTPVAGLRGRSGIEPQNLMRREPQRPQAPRPGSTIIPQEQWTTRGERQGTMRRVEPQGTSLPGILDEMGLRLPGSRQPPSSSGQPTGTTGSANPDEVTLEEILRSLNFDFSGLPGPRRRFESPNQTPRNSNVVRIPEDQQLVDVYADLGSGTVQQTSSRPRGGFVRPPNAGQWEGRAPEVEAWVRAGNIRLTEGAGYRTNRALQGGHPAGNSLDVPPNQIDDVITRIRANPEFRDIPIERIFIRRGQVVGHNRDGTPITASGDHWHLDFGSAAN